jgi:hypothetical protein
LEKHAQIGRMRKVVGNSEMRAGNVVPAPRVISRGVSALYVVPAS